MTSNDYDFDLIVLGGGSGGVRASRWAGNLGAKVAIVESDRYGGTCVIRGCIPKKFLVLSSSFSEEFEAAKNYGWDVSVKGYNWKAFKAARDKEISRLSGLYQGMLEKSGVTRINGKGRLVGPHEVEVNGQRYSAKYILIATGGKPFVPPVPGSECTMTSDQMFELEQMPKSVVIIGAGYIGVEFAGIFNGLGCDVSMVYRADQVLSHFERDCGLFLEDEITKKGIRLYKQSLALSFSQVEEGIEVTTDKGETLVADVVLCATGRIPNTAGIGLESVGIKVSPHGAIQVNEAHQTTVPHIYAVGDCTDRVNLTPIATAGGMEVAENLFGQAGRYPVEYDHVPTAVFSQPPMSTVGLSEGKAVQEGYEVEVFESRFRALKHTLSGLEERTYMKMVVDKKTNRVLGCHMVGLDAPEIMQGVAVALKAGATKDVFDRTIGIHPSSAEEFVTMRTPRQGE